MGDVTVSVGAAWTCQDQGRLSDILLPVRISDESRDNEELSRREEDLIDRCGPVLLEQTEEGSPCVLTLRCSPDANAGINRLLVVSEARTAEVYGQTGEYYGTGRGERDGRVQTEKDRGPFYRKQLILDNPSTSCELKLLSLAGRNDVLVRCLIVGLQPLQPCSPSGPSIDMQQVQSLMEDMGASLSPGAQNLMDMVQFQQQNQSASLGGFLPLLMGGGALSALVGGANVSLAAAPHRTLSAWPPAGSADPANQAPPAQNEALCNGSISISAPSGTQPPGSNAQNPVSSENRGPLSGAQLTEMMSHFLNQRDHGMSLSSAPEFLPVLQSVCGQVTQLRLDVAAVAERERNESNGA
ncbi:ATPase PAAT isoform X2 [Genypterus blacodes]